MNKTDTHKINGAGPQLPKKDSAATQVFTKVEPKLHPLAAAIAARQPDPPLAGPAPQRPKAAATEIPEKKPS